ncbi:MAG: hypothetical protein V1794_13570 [Candidatus Glassbacteria bacterium]
MHCLSFIKPKTNEGQFWGTGLMVAGILIGIFSYVSYLQHAESLWLQVMIVGIFLAYLGFIVYGVGTFTSWFKLKIKVGETDPGEGKKLCIFCGSVIHEKAIKCNNCFGYLRQERGKILATFAIVSGILIMTTAYIVSLARNIQQSGTYMQVGFFVIVAGIMIFMLLALRNRYSDGT